MALKSVAGCEEKLEVVNDDEIARLDTMCTSTMHGDGWLKRFGKLLREKYGLMCLSETCSVNCRFGGGERKTAKFRDLLPVGIGGVNGEISNQCIPDSPTALLLSLEAQRQLGITLRICAGNADIDALGCKI
jgi:hypothetical protein